MTRLEVTGKRSLKFSQWIRAKLPDSGTGFCVGNQDWIFWNYNKRRLILAEEKTRGGLISRWFYRFIKEVMDPALKLWSTKVNIDYRGYHLIQFENEGPDDGKIYLDKKEINEEDLQKYLSLED